MVTVVIGLWKLCSFNLQTFLKTFAKQCISVKKKLSFSLRIGKPREHLNQQTGILWPQGLQLLWLYKRKIIVWEEISFQFDSKNFLTNCQITQEGSTLPRLSSEWEENCWHRLRIFCQMVRQTLNWIVSGWTKLHIRNTITKTICTEIFDGSLCFDSFIHILNK